MKDRYWIEQEDLLILTRSFFSTYPLSLFLKMKAHKVFFQKEKEGYKVFSPKIEVRRGSSGYSSSVKSYLETACAQEFSKEATGVQLSGCAALWVCT